MATELSEGDVLSCFVAMPIRSEGTPEHEHFSAIYEVISDSVTSFGMKCERIDHDSSTGNITKGIVQKLAESDLVIADLSDLNPNVFYELGVRHALRRSGTILIIDKVKTDRLPFDINQYRVISYEGTLPGSRKLASELRLFISTWFDAHDAPAVDSPVHEWYPTLPTNLIKASETNADDAMHRENAALRQQLESLRGKERGEDSAAQLDSERIDRIRRLHRAAEAKEMPSDFLIEARSAVAGRDLAAFFRATEHFMTSPYQRQPSQFRTLAILAQSAGQDAVGVDIIQEGLTIFPDDADLQNSLWLGLTRSGGTRSGTVAKQLTERLQLDLDSEEFADPAAVTANPNLVGYLSSHLHDAGEDEKALRLMRAALEFGTSSKLLLYFARQLDWTGLNEEAFDAYLDATQAVGADEDAYVWFGNFLHNNGFHVDASGLFLVSTLYDMQDGGHFISMGDELSWALYQPLALESETELAQLPRGRRPAPAGVDRGTLLAALDIGLSAPQISEDARQRVQRVIHRSEIDADEQGKTPRLNLEEKLEWVAATYKSLDLSIDLNESVQAILQRRA